MVQEKICQTKKTKPKEIINKYLEKYLHHCNSF